MTPPVPLSRLEVERPVAMELGQPVNHPLRLRGRYVVVGVAMHRAPAARAACKKRFALGAISFTRCTAL